MRTVFAAAMLFVLSLPAFAANTEGTITGVDPQNMTITLDDGETYNLPPEIDMTAIVEGVVVLIAYDKTEEGANRITDMVLSE